MSAPLLEPIEQRRRLLGMLFGGAHGVLDLRFIAPDGRVNRISVRDGDDAEHVIAARNGGQENHYFGVATRRSPGGGGGKDNLQSATALWIDVDFEDESNQDALEIVLKTFPLRPTARVWTGGGEHVYWLLAKPFDLTTPESIQRFEATLKGLADYFKADSRATDASRVLRVPGTQNYPDKKKRDKGRTESPCFLKDLDPGRFYGFEQFEDFEQRGTALIARNSGPGVDYTATAWDGRVPTRVQSVLNSQGPFHRELQRRWNGDTTGLNDPSDSAIDQSIANHLAGMRMDADVIEHALRARRAQYQAKAKRDDYFRRTVGKALNRAQLGELDRADPGERPSEVRGGEEENDPGPVVIRLADVRSEPVEWLWEGRTPRGKFVLVDGDPGLGKSNLTLDLAARVTRGGPMPDGSKGIQGTVVLVSAEDGLSDTIRPRLEAAGADLDRVFAITSVRGPDSERMPELPRDLELIERVVMDRDAVLLVLDPLMAFLGGQINSHKDQDVREALTPLAKMAERTGVSVLVVRHLNKRTGDPALYRGGGSIGIVGAARVELVVGPDPQYPDRRVLAVGKNNLAPKADSLGFRLVTARNGTSAVEWLGVVDHDATAILSAPSSEESRSARSEAEQFLMEVLTAGPRTVSDIKREAMAAGISSRTLDRAKAALGVTAHKRSFSQGWEWRLPTPPSPPNSLEREVGGLREVGALRDHETTKTANSIEDRQDSSIGDVALLAGPAGPA